MSNKLSRFVYGRILKKREYFRPVMLSSGRHIYLPWVMIGPHATFEWRNAAYKIRKDRVSFLGSTPSAVYIEDNPDPLPVEDWPLPEVRDERGELNEVTASEFRSAIDAAAVQQLVRKQGPVNKLVNAMLIIGVANLVGLIILGWKIYGG